MRNEGHFGSVRENSAFNIVELLKTCASLKDLEKGTKLHAFIKKHNFLEKNAYIGSSLVNMYAKCGALSKAQEVLLELPVRNVVTWNALMAGYVQQGQGEEALKCYNDMQQQGYSPTAVAITCALKACGSIGAAVKGKEIHDQILTLGMLEKDIVLGNMLVDMYAKCGELCKAHQALDNLSNRDVVTWSALINGYVQHGQGEEALKCFDSMQSEGHSPNAVTFTCVLKACGSIGAYAKGEEIHDKIAKLSMLHSDIVLGTALIDMYARCGMLCKAQHVLEEVSVRDVVMWNALMSGYSQEGQGEETCKCLDNLLYEGHIPDMVTFTCALRSCGVIGAVVKGEQIYHKIVSLAMMENTIVIGNALVDMYAKCGRLFEAQWVLEELLVRDVITWTALMTGYVEQGQGEEALKCYDSMRYEGHFPNAVTITCALKACGSIGAATKGKEIHDKIVHLGMLEKDVVRNTLVDMYVKCGALAKAQQVIEELPVRDAVTWSTLIGGYAQQGHGHEALKCLDGMLGEGHSPDVVTFICALKACGSIGALAKGEEIHEKIVDLHMLEKDVVLASTLLNMYVKCGMLPKAQEVLEDLPVRTVAIWNALIVGYAQQGQGEEALKCFDDMLYDGHFPDGVSFTYALKACASIGATAKGEEIHGKIANLAMLGHDLVLGASLVDMYAKCGIPAKAQSALKELPGQNVVIWNALMAGYVQQGQGEEALKCLDNMLHEGHTPDVVTLTCALKACGTIGAAARGRQIHDTIVSLGIPVKNVVLGNTLVDMYAKCGVVLKAREVFEELTVWDLVTWTALIGGYAQQGLNLEAISCFELMLSKEVTPDSATFILVLNACSHSGQLYQAETFFSGMSAQYGMKPDLKHYCCMVDLFGRAGSFKKALSVIGEMPFDDYFPMWAALLAACRKWTNVKIGRAAFERAFCMDKNNAAVYEDMACIYAAAGMLEDMDRIQIVRMAINAWKWNGCWCTDDLPC